MRSGASRRATARAFEVGLGTVERALTRAADDPLDEVDWADRSRTPGRTRRVAPQLEDTILELRRQLREDSALGEYGAAAIRHELLARLDLPWPVPSLRTVGRILERRGALDGRGRIRHPAPPRGWYLPDVRVGEAELDSFDVIEGLKIASGPLVDVLTGISLHGGLVAAWPSETISGPRVVEALVEHWAGVGLPGYAQFDNDTRFHGSHAHRDQPGPVTRLCLSLGVVPVFAPPHETGFQAAIESFNGRWQSKVWQRTRFGSLRELLAGSAGYVEASRRRAAVRIEGAPDRRRSGDAEPRSSGRMIFLRRTTDEGAVTVLGRRYEVDRRWVHRLVRTEIDLEAERIRFFALRRRAPLDQPLLGERAYTPRPERHRR